MWWMFWACRQNTGALPPLPEPHDPKIEASPSEQRPPSEGDAPPSHNSEMVQEAMTLLQSDSTLWTNRKSCQVTSTDPDVPGGWMFYAWNTEATIGMVVSVHTVQPANVSEGANQSLDVAARDAFVMIEIGEEIPTNFCVASIQQIPVSTVLESMSGQVELQRQADAWTVRLNDLRFKDQYGGQQMVLPSTTIETTAIQVVP
jgi:hypothetical protein